MTNKNKVIAAALYEIRVLLSMHLGSTSKSDPEVRLAAHLAYTLHNDALAEIEGTLVAPNSSHQRTLEVMEEMIGSKYADQYGLLTNRNAN